METVWLERIVTVDWINDDQVQVVVGTLRFGNIKLQMERETFEEACAMFEKLKDMR